MERSQKLQQVVCWFIVTCHAILLNTSWCQIGVHFKERSGCTSSQEGLTSTQTITLSLMIYLKTVIIYWEVVLCSNGMAHTAA